MLSDIGFIDLLLNNLIGQILQPWYKCVLHSTLYMSYIHGVRNFAGVSTVVRGSVSCAGCVLITSRVSVSSVARLIG